LNKNYPDYNLIISGDFNVNFLNENKKNVKELYNIFNEYGLKQLIKTYTYPSKTDNGTHRSLLDLLIVNNEEIISNIATMDSISVTCDHLLVSFELIVENSDKQLEDKYFTDFNNEKDLLIFKDKLIKTDWDSIFNQSTCIDVIYENMMNKLVQYKSECFIPKKILKKKPKVDENLKKLINSKRIMFKLFMITNDKFYEISTIYLFDKIRSELEKFHFNRYKKLIEKSDNFKTLYKTVKNFKTESCSTFTHNNQVINAKQEICEYFSESFSSKFTQISYPSYNSISLTNQNKITEFTITLTDVLRGISNMKTSKSCIGSEIPTQLIKNCSETLSKVLFSFFNLMLKKGEIPLKLKEVTVLPVIKKGKKKELFDSYRPITIEKNILKLFCKLIFNNISAFLNEYSLIPSNQYGFRPGISCVNQIIDIFFYITDSLNDPDIMCIDLIFLDKSSAFDRLPFKLILEKCFEIGISEKCIKIIESYLFNRKQSVLFENNLSNSRLIQSGVPQGGVGSPDLFNISVKDFPIITQFSKLFQFADDSCLIKCIKTVIDIDDFQTDLNNVQNYCTKMNFLLNTEKSTHLRICFKNIPPLKTYKLNNIDIPLNINHKHLGIIFDNKLSNNDWVDHIYNNSMKKWNFLVRVFPFAGSDILLMVYKTYVLPNIEYCNLSLILNVTQNIKIEKIQRKITKQILCKIGIFDLGYNERLIHLNIMSLESRRKLSYLKTLYNCINKSLSVPPTWMTKFKFSNNVRNGKVLYKPKTRNNLTDKNFFIYSIDLFNSLPRSLRDQILLKTFVKNCKSFLIDSYTI
jgi:hypothetical protein